MKATALPTQIGIIATQYIGGLSAANHSRLCAMGELLVASEDMADAGVNGEPNDESAV